MKRFLAGLLFLVLHTSNVSGQETIGCITNLDSETYHEMISQPIRSSVSARMFDIQGLTPKLAITVHIVRNSDGSGGITESYIYNEIENVNQFYINAGFQFYIDQIRYINNSNFYDFNITEESALADSRDIPNTINMYFVQSINFTGGSACGYAYYPSQVLSRAVIAESCGLDGNTIAHELGHFFDLIHTHGPVNQYGSTNELVNGSNCNSTGDLICDTPADPMLLNIVDSNCNYNAGYRDANNQLYNPDTHNLMSYSRASCRESFTSDQYLRMNTAYIVSRSNLKIKPTLAGFESDKQKICSGDQIMFSDASTQANTWNWSFEGGSPAQSTEQSPSITYNETGSFKVTLEVNGPGGNDVLQVNDYVIVREIAENITGLAEGFETQASGDELFTDSNGAFNFDLNQSFSSEGVQSIWVNSFASSPNQLASSKFLTNPISQNLNGQYLLQFDYAHASRLGYSDLLEISLENFCSGELSNIYTKSAIDLSGGLTQENEFFPENDDWKTEGLFFNTIDQFNPFSVVFDFQSQGGNNIFFDNIKIRPVKAIDEDSLVLVSIYNAMSGQLPWDMNASVSTWYGVTLSEADRVVGLDFTGLNLTGELPSDLADLTRLESLIIDNNSITPSSTITALSSLKKLSFNDNGLTQLPTDWSAMVNLKSVEIRNNNLRSLPASLLTLETLENIDVRNNELVYSGDEQIQLSSSIKRIDISANGISSGPSFSSGNSDLIIDLTQNQLTFDWVLNNNSPSNIYSPQNLYGTTTFFNAESDLLLTCPIPTSLSSSHIDWYRNNELLLENNSNLTISDYQGAYYSCVAYDDEIQDFKLFSRPMLVNNYKSICDYNLAGSYRATSNYTDQNEVNYTVTANITMTTVGNQVYNFSDLSFGIEDQLNDAVQLNASMGYDCGHLFTPVLESYSYKITNTSIDLSNESILVNWINDRGGTGVTTLEKTESGLSNKTDFLGFEFESQSSPEMINAFDKTINLRVGCNQFSNIPTFEISEGAKAYVNGVLQESGLSAQDFSNDVIYKVVAEDGISFSNWTITLDEEPKVVEVAFSAIDQSFCNPENGALSIDNIFVDGIDKTQDLGDFTILWSDASTFENVISSGASIQNLSAGQYFLRVVEDASGCGVEINDIVVNDITPQGSLTISQINPDESCGGTHTGSIESTIDGLSEDVDIRWSFFTNGSFEYMDQYDGLLQITNVESGQYRQEIRDIVTGCIYNQSVTVNNQPSVLTVETTLAPNTDCTDPNGNILITSISQNGTNLGLPQAGYSIEWYNDISLQNVIGSSYELIGLESGVYYMKVIDNNLLCESPLYSFFVPSNTLSENIVLTARSNNSSCSSGSANGTLNASVNGETSGYSFEWYSGNQTETNPISTSSSVTGLVGGTYTVKVTSAIGDDSGCFSTLTTSITNELESLTLSVISNPVTTCNENNGSVEVDDFSINGRSSPIIGSYNIEWSTSNKFSTIISERNDIDGLTTGTYYARVTNSTTGCKSNIASVAVTEDLPAIQPQFQIENNKNCAEPFSGSIALTGLDPTSDFNISWYDQSLNDQSAPISVETILNNKEAGLYYSVVTHLASGCIKQFEHVIQDESVIPEITVTTSDLTQCSEPNGMIEIIVIKEGDAIQPMDQFSVQWSSDENFNTILSSDLKVNGLANGVYFARVKNNSTGCESSTFEYTIYDNRVEPSIELVMMSEQKQALNELGSLSVSVEYNGEYQLQWYKSNDVDGLVISDELQVSSLSADSYLIRVTTDQGCISTAEFEVLLDDRQLQTIDLELPTEVYIDNEDLVLSGTSTSGLPVLFDVKSGPGRITFGRLKFDEPGEIILSARVSGNASFYATEEEFTIKVKDLIELSGQINGALTGIVKLYDNNWQFVQQVAYTENIYALKSLQPDQYYLEIIPSGFSSNSLVTYHPNVYSWQNAELIALDESLIVDIELINAPVFDEGSDVEGLVLEKAGNNLITLGELKNEGPVVEGFKLYLIKSGTNELYASARSDFDGNISFGPVPSGNYYLYNDQIGSSLDFSSVVFSLDGESDEQFTLEIGDNNEVELFVVSGINEWVSGEVTFYPNPVNDDLHITLDNSISYPIGIRIYNLTGAMVLSETIQPRNSTIQLSLSALVSGTYLIQLSDHKGSTSRKIIKR